MSDVIAVSGSAVGQLVIPGHPLAASLRAADDFLNAYAGHTKTGYTRDLMYFFEWCGARELIPLDAKRSNVEAYIRFMKDERPWKSATVSKRYDTVRGYFRAADCDEVLPGKDPCAWVKRPRIDRRGQSRPFLDVLEHGRFLAAAAEMGPRHHAFAAIIGISALRIAEACSLDIEKMTVERGLDVINFIGKGHEAASVSLPVPVMRAVREQIDDRTDGPILTTKWKTRLTPSTGRRMCQQIGTLAGISRPVCPHMLRRSAATTGKHAGLHITDLQQLLRHRNLTTTGDYVCDVENPDSNASNVIAAFLSGMSRVA